jgi:hypothetical protein
MSASKVEPLREGSTGILVLDLWIADCMQDAGNGKILRSSPCI